VSRASAVGSAFFAGCVRDGICAEPEELTRCSENKAHLALDRTFKKLRGEKKPRKEIMRR